MIISVFDIKHLKRNKKRIKYIVDDIDKNIQYAHKITLNPVYVPSPKSQLLSKNIFTKNTMKLI